MVNEDIGTFYGRLRAQGSGLKAQTEDSGLKAQGSDRPLVQLTSLGQIISELSEP